MTIRNLEKMFNPGSIVLVGASSKPGSVGNTSLRNLIDGGFEGEIFLVNPKGGKLNDQPVYASVRELPKAPDLALIATPPDTVPGIIADLGMMGTRDAVVITAGFTEGDNAAGKMLCDQMLEAAKPHVMRIIGPNCLGIQVPRIHLNAGFAPLTGFAGKIAFVTQSGAVMAAVLDWATHRQIGFSHCVSMGDMSDVDFGDMLDYLCTDSHTRAILLYIEAVTNARKFISAARAAARVKPVIVVKAGRYAEAAKAAVSHTGAMAGSDAVYDAVFRRAGMLRVNDLQALFDAVTTLAMLQPVRGDRLAILTNGGGIGVMATDVLIFKEGRLAELSAETIGRLNGLLPSTWSHGNPVDIIGDASPARYCAALSVLLQDTGIDAVLVIHCPTAITSSLDTAAAVVETAKSGGSAYHKPALLTAWVGETSANTARRVFLENKIPTYDTPTEAVRGFMQMVRYRRSQELLIETPPDLPADFSPDTGKAKAVIQEALDMGRHVLTEPESKALLRAYEIPVVETRTVHTPSEAAVAAKELGCPVALKILSPDITHKSDVGGVVLHLSTPQLVEKAAEAMVARVQGSMPGAQIKGFTVQPMVDNRHGHELILGMSVDRQFGPVILFGHGGVAAEIIADHCIGLPPLNMKLAMEMMSRTRIARLFSGYRDVPATDVAALAFTLVKVSQLVCDMDGIVELDINPLIAGANGVMALDARVCIAPAQRPAKDRLAICPYPKELEESVTLADGKRYLIRPIRPEDEPAFLEMFESLPPEDVRFRFLHPMKYMPHTLAARLTQIDYDREMAFVLTDADTGGRTLYGAVRVAADPDRQKGEFAILLRREMTGLGLGMLLMQWILDYSRKTGIGEIYGEVLSDNSPMLRLGKAFGFTLRRSPEDPGVQRISLTLS